MALATVNLDCQLGWIKNYLGQRISTCWSWPLCGSNDHFTGVRMFTVWFIRVTKIESWRSNRNNSVVGHHHSLRNCIKRHRKVEIHWSRRLAASLGTSLRVSPQIPEGGGKQFALNVGSSILWVRDSVQITGKGH